MDPLNAPAGPLAGTPLSRRAALRFAGALALTTSSGSLLSACSGRPASTPSGSSAAPGDPQGTGVGGELSAEQIPTLGWAVPRSIPTLDVAKDFSDFTLTAATLTLEPLLVVDQQLALKPWLGTLTRPDPKTLVFDLRPGVKFTDGSPLTPEDVAFSWERHLDPKLASQLSSYLASFDSIAKTGADQVTIRLKNPDPAFAYISLFVGIHNRAFGQKAGAKLGTPEVGVLGTGMYVLSDHTPDAGLTATRNPQYWGEKPRIEQLKLQVITNFDTLRLAISSGSVGGSFDLPLASARQFRSAKGVRVGVTKEALISTFLTFPVNQAPFDDVNVRRAVAYCIDRQALATALLGGAGQPATSVSTPAQWSPLLGPDGAKRFLAGLPSYAFDVQKAKAELAKSAKHASGFTAVTKVPSDDAELSKIALSLKQNLAQIGVTLDVQQISTDTYNTEVFSSKTPGLWLTRLNPVLIDPTDYLGIVLPSSGIPAGGYNFAGYRNASVDKLLADQAAAGKEARIDMLKRVAQTAQDELPYVPIYWPSAAMALSDTLRYRDFNPDSPSLPWVTNVGKPAS